MKRRKSLLLYLVLIGLVTGMLSYPQTEVKAAKVTKIYTYEDLAAISENLEGKYLLMNDIDLSEYDTWTPIGTSDNPFSGVFNGNKHTVSNLEISSEGDYVGLFGYAYNATIKNLTVTGAIEGSSYIGGIVGKLDNSTLFNCVNKAEIKGINQVGGVIGRIAKSEVYNCQNEGKVTASGRASGGITSDIYPSGSITNCTNLANVTGGTDLNGGITGGSTSGTITNCNNYGNVTGKGRCGAIAGDNAGYAGSRSYNYFRKTAKANSGYNIYGSNCATYKKAGGKLSSKITIGKKTYSYAKSALNGWRKGSKQYKSWKLVGKHLKIYK